jgi:hypothetical protein
MPNRWESEVADARDIVHQIEYRWHDRRDLSPVASTMSPQSLRGWDSWIRTWVRHPHTDGLWESVCYQILPTGRAALAWRYEDWQAAEREDGSRGRPFVSRVLAGQVSLLNPDAAIVLCRTGWPAAVMPPGQAQGTAERGLAVVGADRLSNLVRAQTQRLDEEAAQQGILQQIVAAALSDPHTPLAIYLRDACIRKPPAEGLQCPLLWGLRRVAWPVLGTAGRGWSFSTFEPPLGEVDPATLPDVLFRQLQDTPLTAPARPRKELKLRLSGDEPPDLGDPYIELAGWLIVEYRERGGDGLRRAIAEWCGAEVSLQSRLGKIYKELSSRWLPAAASGALTSGLAEAPALAKPGESPQAEPAADAPPQSRPPAEAPPQDHPSEDVTAGSPPPPRPAGQQVHFTAEPPVFADDQAMWQSDYGQPDHDWIDAGQSAGPYGDRGRYAGGAAQPRQGDDLPPSIIDDQQSGYSPLHRASHSDEPQDMFPRARIAPSPPWNRPEQASIGTGQHFGEPAPRRATVSDLLKKLAAAADMHEFTSVLGDILSPDPRSDASDRVKARREMSKDSWHASITGLTGQPLDVDMLAKIFQIIIIPDIHNQEALKKIADWAGHAPESVIGGLLLAARQSGNGFWQFMTQVLEPVLARRWTIDNNIQGLWYSIADSPHSNEYGRARFSFWKRG